MQNRNDEERVASICNTGKGVIPSGECGQNAECASRADAAGVGVATAVAEVADAKHEESHVKREEEEEEGDRGLQRAQKQDEREDEPALWSLVSVYVDRCLGLGTEEGSVP
jgi:hypothetical protein